MTGPAREPVELARVLARVAGRRLVLGYIGPRSGYRETVENGVHAELGDASASRTNVAADLEAVLSAVLGPRPESAYSRRYEAVSARERVRVHEVATLVADGVPLEWAIRRTEEGPVG